MTLNELNAIILTEMARKNITMGRLAHLAGTNRARISNVLNGHHTPRWDTVCLICDVLGLKIEVLRGDIEWPAWVSERDLSAILTRTSHMLAAFNSEKEGKREISTELLFFWARIKVKRKYINSVRVLYDIGTYYLSNIQKLIRSTRWANPSVKSYCEATLLEWMHKSLAELARKVKPI